MIGALVARGAMADENHWAGAGLRSWRPEDAGNESSLHIELEASFHDAVAGVRLADPAHSCRAYNAAVEAAGR